MKAHLVYGPWLPACLNCEEEIPLKRLRAVPNAKYCRDCQEQFPIIVAISAGVIAEAENEDDVRGRESGWHVPAQAVFKHVIPQGVA